MLDDITLESIRAARRNIAHAAIRTPLIELNYSEAPAQIYLKLENLQPIGSFKLRGATNAMSVASQNDLKAGVVTASAGNMAQGVAWNARRLGIPCTVIVPDHAPEAKLTAIRRLGAHVDKVSFDEWWKVIETEQCEHAGLFIHPVCNPAVIAGNGTIGLEILEDLPDVDSVIIPFGGGGLSCGIASAIRATQANTKIYACEVATAAPLSAALGAGSPRTIDYESSFVDGIGSTSVLTAMWPLVRSLIDTSLVVTPAEIANAIRLLIERNHVVAEGAGAAAVAAALAGEADGDKIVCIVSGGNIDTARLAKILGGETPQAAPNFSRARSVASRPETKTPPQK